ncbi:JAB domain-containing protein [Ekhidna sp.]|jgi:DNA repair protein RadC|uniref:JAB domain-containing protein n=1 Tax=Ekhidna sp. TaxID=2608089 RepID=UPI0032EED2A8
MTEINLSKISEVELVYRRKVRANDRPKISNSQDAYSLFRENWDDLTINLYEQFKVMLLDRNNRCMGISTISSGGVSGTVVDAKLIFALALKGRACNLIVAHNHPSGNLTPSSQDMSLTRKLCEAGKVLDTSILDHLILTDESYYSIADEGLMPH